MDEAIRLLREWIADRNPFGATIKFLNEYKPDSLTLKQELAGLALKNKRDDMAVVRNARMREQANVPKHRH